MVLRMMFKIFCCCICFVTGLSHAHLMPAQQGTVNLQAKAAFVVLAVPVSAMSQFDDNRDGRFSQQEMALHRDAIEAQVQTGFQLFDADHALQLDFVQATEEQHEAAELPSAQQLAPLGAKHFLVLMKWTWTRDVPRLRLHLSLFGTASSEQQFSIKILQDKLSEVAILTPHHADHIFFRAWPEIFSDYVLLGVEHILSGWDHLLFLFTLIFATQLARSWRYWLVVLTSFTLAHSLTLGLSLFGVVQPPVLAVEALIMLSISLMAALNVRRLLRADSANSHLGTHATIVFACGLLHGFGFAAAMSAMGLHADYRALSLLGFNLGIELGQMIFLVAVLMCATLLVRTPRKLAIVPSWRIVVNAAILIVSLVVFALRVGEGM